MIGCVSFFRGYFDCVSAFAFSRSFSNELLCLLSGMILFILYIIMLLDTGDVGIFGFGHFLGRFFVFCTEKLRFLGFVGRCGFRFFSFLAPGFLAKIKQVRFLSGSLRSPDVRLFYMFPFYCESSSNCNMGFWIFD